MTHGFLPLQTNRVRRNYGGGAVLDRWEKRPQPTDGNQPEDWLASTTPAINRGMPTVAQEGIGHVLLPEGTAVAVTTLFARHGEFYLGRRHLERLGPSLGFLAKLIDSSMRLHTQVHPTREFAREKLGSPWGKLECYVILGVRPGYPGDLRMGFQNPPTRAEWREIVETQDIARMDDCFTPIPTRAGEVWLVPGAMVHALGAGLLLLEVMEPSDLVVRCEFEREGIVVPPEARFMGRDLEFCLDVFDYAPMPVEGVRGRCQMCAELVKQSAVLTEEIWVPATLTRCFEVRRLIVRAATDWSPGNERCALVIVGAGEGVFEADGYTLAGGIGARFFFAAQGEPVRVRPKNEGAVLELWVCQPAGE